MEKDSSSNKAPLEHYTLLGKVCQAMFIEGARQLGYDLYSPMPRAAQEQVRTAACLLAERLQALFDLQDDDDDPESESTEE